MRRKKHSGLLALGGSIAVTGSYGCELRRDDLTVGQKNALHAGKTIGYGSFACVYENEAHPDRVVKLTTDRDDANATAALGGKGIKFIPKVHGVHQLLGRDGKIQDLWAIEVEKVAPLPAHSDEAAAVGILNDYLVTFPVGGYPKKIKAKARLLKDCRDAKDTGFLHDADACAATIEEAVKVYDGLQKVGYAFEDAHPGNWGRTADGRLVAIDLGYSSSVPKGSEALPTLAGAKKRRRRRMFGATEEMPAGEKGNLGNFFIGLVVLGVAVFAFTKANPIYTEKK